MAATATISAFVFMMLIPYGATNAAPRPLVGAIRWDAWVGDYNPSGVPGGIIGLPVEKSLGPHQFHDRIPFFGKETGPDSVEARELTQDVMDKEIHYACDGGIDYWAFDWYNDGSGLALARHLYMSSSIKSLVKFCFVLQNTLPRASFPRLIGTFFKDPDYLKVLGDRPVVYLFCDNYTPEDLGVLRDQTRATSLGNPYIVDCATGSKAPPANFHYDAVSHYVTGATMGQPFKAGAPFADVMRNSQDRWNNDKTFGLDVVPNVTAGADVRPRIITPIPWARYYPDNWSQEPTPDEVGAHVKQAFDWIDGNPTVDPARLVLIYAWNEFDEGGYICPTLMHGSDRLDAIRKVVDAYGKK